MGSTRAAWYCSVVVAVSIGAVGCSRFGSDADTTTATTAPVLQAPVAETDFCSKMYEIRANALDGDQAISDEALAEEYRAALAVAPDDIKPDLEAVISSLESGAPITTQPGGVEADDLDGEGWQPSNDPAERVFDYVDTYCSGTAANPGPAATPPP